MQVRFLNINQKISAIAAGVLNGAGGLDRGHSISSERVRSSTGIGGLDRVRDILVVGTQTNLLAYDVEQYPPTPPPRIQLLFFSLSPLQEMQKYSTKRFQTERM